MGLLNSCAILPAAGARLLFYLHVLRARSATTAAKFSINAVERAVLLPVHWKNPCHSSKSRLLNFIPKALSTAHCSVAKVLFWMVQLQESLAVAVGSLVGNCAKYEASDQLVQAGLYKM
jgi:hypothetical protein